MSATGLLVALVYSVLYVVMFKTVYGQLDDDLRAESLEIFKNIVVLSDEIVFASPSEWTEKEHGQVEVDPMFLQVVDRTGAVLHKSPNLRDKQLLFNPAVTQESYFDTTLLNSPVRQVQMPISSPRQRTLGYLTVAMPRKEAELILGNLRLVLFTTFPMVLFIAFAITRYIAGRSVAPVEQIIATAERISSENLDERIPLPKRPDELHRLATTVNDLLDRLQDAVLRERQFTANSSHELRTPLAAIRGTLEVLIRKPRSKEYYIDKISYCISEVDRLSNLVNHLLMLARYDNGSIKPVFTRINLPHVLETITQRIEPILHSKGITVEVLDTNDAEVMADSTMLVTIFENILSNAVKYSKDGATVKIGIQKSNGQVVCAIIDSGVGMSKEQLPMIFDRFYRGDESRASRIDGTGLGLAIVKRLVDLQGLSIDVQSELDHGTTVTIGFPPENNMSRS
jgi:heavy metal sensor kinase